MMKKREKEIVKNKKNIEFMEDVGMGEERSTLDSFETIEKNSKKIT